MNRWQQQPLYLAGVLALALLLAFSAPALANDVKGIILSLEPDDHTFDLVAEEGNVLNFRLEITAPVLINDEERTIWDLKPGDNVSVVYELYNEVMVATFIRCTRD